MNLTQLNNELSFYPLSLCRTTNFRRIEDIRGYEKVFRTVCSKVRQSFHNFAAISISPTPILPPSQCPSLNLPAPSSPIPQIWHLLLCGQIRNCSCHCRPGRTQGWIRSTSLPLPPLWRQAGRSKSRLLELPLCSNARTQGVPLHALLDWR